MEERDRFVRGTLVGTLGAVAVGLTAFGFFGMWDWALGFASGALVSFASFQLIVASVARFTERPVPKGHGKGKWWAWSLLRLLGAAVALFLVVSYLPVNLIGVALGLAAVQLGMGGYFIVRSSLQPSGDVGMEDRKA